MNLNDISYQIRGAVFEVYNVLGPGLLENIYEQALLIELNNRCLKVENQVPIEVLYKGVNLGIQYRLDFLINDQVILELKSVDTLLPVHYKQLITYLKIAKKPLGFLINFNTDSIKDNIIRVANDVNHPDLQ
ncbi:MAG: GxxExxY protein [Candidatus Cloacimonadaceae bacterium]|jgi:GxxExxY protein